MRRAAFRPAAPPWITTRVSLVARMLMGISPLACPVGLIRLPLQRHVDDVGERGMAVDGAGVRAFAAERAQPCPCLPLPGPPPGAPELPAPEPCVRAGLLEPVDGSRR